MHICAKRLRSSRGKTHVQKHLALLEWLVPNWCHRIHVHWQEQGGVQNATITCKTDYEYRNVVITFYPAFLSQKEPQYEHLIHDLLHAFSSIAIDFAEETIKLLFTENEAPKFREHLLRELRIKTEASRRTWRTVWQTGFGNRQNKSFLLPILAGE